MFGGPHPLILKEKKEGIEKGKKIGFEGCQGIGLYFIGAIRTQGICPGGSSSRRGHVVIGPGCSGKREERKYSPRYV